MAMKHFDTDFFGEIITGMKQTCEGLEVQQLLQAATSIYLAGNSAIEAVKEGSWKVEAGGEKTYRCKKIVECPFCGTRRGVFMGDTIDYCAGCGARMVEKK